MTENLLQRLEEKMMTLVSEVEALRTQVSRLVQENTKLLAEKDANTHKLSELIALLDTVTSVEAPSVSAPSHHVTHSLHALVNA